jgi:hypothetical protein
MLTMFTPVSRPDPPTCNPTNCGETVFPTPPETDCAVVMAEGGVQFGPLFPPPPPPPPPVPRLVLLLPPQAVRAAREIKAAVENRNLRTHIFVDAGEGLRLIISFLKSFAFIFSIRSKPFFFDNF